MFRKFHEKLKEREEGFTLIELLVVILIIAILAAIAIPVFLRQREKGWVSQMESALKNAATAQESYLTGEGEYTADIAELEDEGWKYAADIENIVITVDTGNAWCVELEHATLEDADVEPMAMSSEVTTPTKAADCGASGVLTP